MNLIKKMMMTLRTLKYISLFILVALLGCYEEQNESATKGSISIRVDESVAPTMKLVTDEFQKLYTETKIYDSIVSSREAIADLLNEKTNFIISSRDFNTEEKEIINKFNLNIITYKIAIDGLVILVNKKNSLKQIDILEIKKIFTGEITDWKNIKEGFISGPIQVITESSNSGGYEFIKNKILGGKDFVKSAYPCTSSKQVIEMVSKVPNSIGWVGLSWKPKDDKNVKVLEVAEYDSTSIVQNYFEPHQAHIYRKYYPITRSIFLFLREKGVNVGSGLTTFFTHEGQKIILNSGLVPATYPVRLIQIGSQ